MNKIHNWAILMNAGSMSSLLNPYKAPEDENISLCGEVGDNRHDTIITSPIAKIEDGVVITTSGSKYVLGDVYPDYEWKYPDAKERLIKRGFGKD